MVLPGWIGNQGDVVEGGRSAEALVWEPTVLVSFMVIYEEKFLGHFGFAPSTSSGKNLIPGVLSNLVYHLPAYP
jgi:hypothetical protein